jgi:hypothetical protein
VVRGVARPEVTCNCYTRGVADCDFLFSGCSRCSANAFDGEWVCTSCKAGTRMTSSRTACVPCPVGKHSRGGTQQICTPCTGGYSTSGPGSVACDICLPGFGQQGTGSTLTCTACQPGYYSAGLGPCDSCPPGFTSGPQAASCPSELFVAEQQCLQQCWRVTPVYPCWLHPADNSVQPDRPGLHMDACMPACTQCAPC